MSELTPGQRRDFLQFTTGSPKLPIGGEFYDKSSQPSTNTNLPRRIQEPDSNVHCRLQACRGAAGLRRLPPQRNDLRKLPQTTRLLGRQDTTEASIHGHQGRPGRLPSFVKSSGAERAPGCIALSTIQHSMLQQKDACHLYTRIIDHLLAIRRRVLFSGGSKDHHKGQKVKNGLHGKRGLSCYLMLFTPVWPWVGEHNGGASPKTMRRKFQIDWQIRMTPSWTDIIDCAVILSPLLTVICEVVNVCMSLIRHVK